MTSLFGLGSLVDPTDLYVLLSRLGLNLLVTTVLVLGVYRRLYRSQELVFTYFTFNVITFSMCLLLSKVPMELGFALGLFAVFGILRYRTEPIRMRALPYMFVVIGVAIINAVANEHISLVELLIVDALIVAVTFAVETHPSLRRHATTPLTYDNLALLARGREAELRADIARRTGLDVVKVELQHVDLLRDAANLVVHHEARPASTDVDLESKPSCVPVQSVAERGAP